MQHLRIPFGIISAIILSGAIAQPGFAQYLLPGTASGQATSGITLTKPATTSTENQPRTGLTGATAYVDDVFLSTVTFGSTTFSTAGGQFRGVGNVNVVSGATNVNAEYGDFDTGSDGNPNPFVIAGLNPADSESTNPAIQRPSIRAAFNSLSLVQGIDGEGAPYVLDLIFQRGINDNDAALDSVPELIFFERGVNSTYSIQVITGGTFNAPIFAPNTITVNSGATGGANPQSRATGYFIDTVEIGTGQELGATGLDLNSFFNGTATTVFGVRITDTNGSDLYGNFLSAASTSQFVPVPAALQGDGFLAETVVIPETGTGLLTLVGGFGTLGAVVSRRMRRAIK